MTDASDASSSEAADARSALRQKLLIRLAIVLGVLTLAYTTWYVMIGRHYVSTDDAYVSAEIAEVTPLVSASIIAIPVHDTQMVKAGQVLAVLDGTDAQIAYAQAQADLAEARRKFRQTQANGASLAAQVKARGFGIAAAQAQLVAARAGADKARIDLNRRQALAASGGVSGEELTTAKRDKAAADAAVARAEADLAQAQSNTTSASGQFAANDALIHGFTEDSDPGVVAAKARLDAANLNRSRMLIRAPIDGIVSQRRAQIGQRVAMGEQIMTLVPLHKVYIDANFKERQLRDVRPGMPADVVADIYGSSVTYHGRVAGIAGATGAATAIIPAQNATGNWIKVVQRLPVRIELDPAELAAHPLEVGLSSEVTINLAGQ